MGNSSILIKWMNYNQKHCRVWSFLILSLVSFSFVVTDWMIGIFTLSDYIFILILICLIVSGNYKVKKTQLKWILLLVSLVVANIIMNVELNDSFILKIGVAAFIRITYYIIVVAGLYNYIKDEHLEYQFLKILNITAIMMGLIGVYITIALYSDGQLPYEFFWTYTRMDLGSYVFKENLSFIRTRSIFSEPAYLGYFLNIILSMNYFNKVRVKINKNFSMLITITILLTFSYSAIGIMLIIQSLYFIEKIRLKKLAWKSKGSLYFLLVVFTIYFSWDFINETIIKRTVSIINGEDISAYNRIISSWVHVNTNHIFLGNGIGHTPNIWNIYAYILSDLGLLAFILSCIFSFYIATVNFKMGIIFMALNFQKGGYLNPMFSILLLITFVYMGSKEHTNNMGYKITENLEVETKSIKT